MNIPQFKTPLKESTYFQLGQPVFLNSRFFWLVQNKSLFCFNFFQNHREPNQLKQGGIISLHILGKCKEKISVMLHSKMEEETTSFSCCFLFLNHSGEVKLPLHFSNSYYRVERRFSLF